MFHTSQTPPVIDQKTIDLAVAKGRRAQSRAMVELVKGLFSAPRTTSRKSDK